MMRASLLRLSPVLVLAAVLVALAVFVVHDTPPDAQAQETTIWSTTLTVAQATYSGVTLTGCGISLGIQFTCDKRMGDETFTFQGEPIIVQGVGYRSTSELFSLEVDYGIFSGRDTELVLRLDDEEFAESEGEVSNPGTSIDWDNHGLNWSEGQVVQVSLVERPRPGALDPTFSAASAITTEIGDGEDQGWGMAVQSDGKAVVAGYSNNGSNDDFALVRYNADGALDPTFDSDGKVTTAIGSGRDRTGAVAVDSDGKIVVAGFSNNGSNNDFALVRYNADGSLDTTFGTDHDSSGSPDGYVTTAIGTHNDVANAVALQSDGKIVVAGYGNTASTTDIALVRYNANGSLDTTFGTDHDSSGNPDGYVTTTIGPSSIARAVAIQSDGKIVVAGYGNGGNFLVARYTTTGALDTTFGVDHDSSGSPDGYVTHNIDLTNDVLTAVAIQSDGKIVATGYTNISGVDTFIVVFRFTAAGALDTTFGTDGADSDTDPDGYVTTRNSPSLDQANAVALQSDGKIVVAGSRGSGGTEDFALARYTTAGALDSTFGTDGTAITSVASGEFGRGADQARAMSILPNGNILAAGYGTMDNDDFALAAYTADGQPASILDAPGWVATKVHTNINRGRAMAVQSDGKIVAAGYGHGGGGDNDFTVVRYDADGSLDTSFDSDGYATIDFGTGFDLGYAVAVDSDGKIVMAGDVSNDFAVARFNADGSPDTSFSGDGKVTTAVGSGEDEAYAVAVQSDGKVLAAGFSHNGTTNDFALVRYTTAGVLDNTFGTGGKVTTGFGNNDKAYAVAVQSDDKIVLAGHNGNSFALARYNLDGTLDDTFGSVVSGTTRSGKVTTDIAGSIVSDVANAVAIQPDGKIVAAGFSWLNFALVRYNANGTLDTSFGTGGKVTTDIAGAADKAYGVAIQADGKIVAAGQGGSSFALVRYQADGSLDTGFGNGGKAVTHFRAGETEIAYAVAIQADDQILAGGYSGLAGEFVVARYNAGKVLVDNADLKDLTVEASTDYGITWVDLALSPAFDADTTGYTATVGNGVGHVRFTTTVADTGRASAVEVHPDFGDLVFSDGQPGGNASLSVGENVFTIRVTAGDGTTTKDYTVTVTRLAEGIEWEGTLNVKDLTNNHFGCDTQRMTDDLKCSTAATLTDDDFIVGGQAYKFFSIHDRVVSGADSFRMTLSENTNAALRGLSFCVGGASYPLSSAIGGGQSDHTEILWENTDVGWSAGDTVSLSLRTACGPPPSTNANLLTLQVQGAASASGPFSGSLPATGFGPAPARAILYTVPNATTHARFKVLVEDTGKATWAVGVQGTTLTGVADNTFSSTFALQVGENTFTLRVTAQDRTTTTEKTVTISRLPAAVTGLAVDAGSSTNEKLSLSWTAPPGTLTGYDVEYKESTATAWTAASHSGTLTTVFISSLTNYRTYDVRVRAKIAAGSGPWARIQIRTSGDYPDPVSGLTVGPGNGELRVSWMAVRQTVDRYDVHYTASATVALGTAAGSNLATEWVDASHASTATADTIENLTNGTPYRVRVRAVRRIGGVDNTGNWVEAPGTPTDIMVRSLGNGGPGQGYIGQVEEGNAALTAVWSKPATGVFTGAGNAITGYDLEYKEASAGNWGSAGHTGLARFKTIPGLTNGTTYHLRVRARTAGNIAGEWSATAQGTPRAPVLPPWPRAANGSGSAALDATFDADGRATTAFGSGDDVANAVALQPDGKIVAAGYSYQAASDTDFALVRYKADGSLDAGFGDGGKVTTAFGDVDERARAMAVQSDGRIVVVGYSGNDIALARYHGDGSLDASFGSGGKVTTAAPGLTTTGASAVALQPDGKIVVAGNRGRNAVVARYTRSGSLDASFGGGGQVVTDLGSTLDTFRAIALRRDGSIVVAGYSGSGSGFQFALVQYTAGGDLDDSFGNGGKVLTTGDGGILAQAVALQPDGKIVAAGYDRNANERFVLARYTHYGALDISFREGGKFHGVVGSADDRAYAMVVQPDGKLLAAGYSHTGSSNDFALARYDEYGRRDTAFGSGFKLTAAIGSGDDRAYAVAVQPDGRIVAAGYSNNGSNKDFAVARFVAQPRKAWIDGVEPGDVSLTVTWGQPLGEPTGYDVEYKASSAAAWTDAGHSGATRTITIPNLTNGTTYDVRVRATNGIGAGPWSSVRHGTPQGGGAQGQGSDGGPAQPTAVTLALDTATVSESAGTATVTVTLDAPAPEGGIGGFLFAGDDGTASADIDFTMPFEIFIPGGQRAGTATISITDDDLDEADETVALSAFFDLGTAILEDKITLTITDDDTAGVTVSAANPLAVNEGGTATYTVVLDSQPTADVTITPASGDVDAVSVSPASRTFMPSTWNTAQTFTVSGVADTDTNGESVTVSHSVASDDAQYGAVLPSTVSVTVSDATTEQQGQTPQTKYAGLIAKMKGWRDDPCCASNKAHTDRWDRALLTFGETVADATLTTMTAYEAQTYADRGWTRWVEVAAALRELENRAPTVSSAIADAAIVNQSGTHQVSFSGVFSDADNDSLAISAGSSDTAVATVSVAADYATLTVSAQARGEATITVTADDGNGGTVSDEFTVTVKAAPVVASAISDVSIEEGSARDVSLSGVFSDADGDSLTITAASSDDAKATVTVAADQSKLTVAGVAEGTATITVTARDPDGNTVSDDFAVSVEPEPEEEEQEQETSDGSPTVVSPLDDLSLEGPERREFDLSGVFQDPDGDDLTFRAVSSNGAVASMWVDGSALTVVGTGTGTATVTVTAEDPDGNTVSDAFDVTVTPASQQQGQAGSVGGSDSANGGAQANQQPENQRPEQRQPAGSDGGGGNGGGNNGQPENQQPKDQQQAGASGAGGGGETIVERRVAPLGSLAFSVPRAAPGSTITLTGTGFVGYAPLQSVLVGGVEAWVGGQVLTDAQGRFTVDLLVPGVGQDRQRVVATVGGQTASGFLVIDPNAVAGAATPVEQAWAGLVSWDLVVAHHDNEDKRWRFYYPAQPGLSDLAEMVAGDVYIVHVGVAITAMLNGKLRTLTCVNGNCWNVIVW